MRWRGGLVLVVGVGAVLSASGPGCALPDKTVSSVPPSACPADLGLSGVFGGGSCEQCLQTSCCAQGTACAQDAAGGCLARVNCTKACTTGDAFFSPACYDACEINNAEADNVDVGYFSCANTLCRTPCGLGSDFSCVDQYRWPTAAASAPTITIGMQLTSASSTGTSLGPGVGVMPCSFSDPTACTFDPTGATTAITDASGHATVHVSTLDIYGNPSNWTGYLAIEKASPLPGALGQLANVLFFQTRQEYVDRPTYDIPLPAVGDIKAAYGIVGAQDPTRGTVVGAMFECRSVSEIFADGVSVSVENQPGVKPIYVGFGDDPLLPDLMLTATSQYGTFLIPNVPAGSQKFVFTKAGVGPVAHVTMFVQAGNVTQLGVWPDTAP